MMNDRGDQPAGMVYIMTNAADNNEVAAFVRASGGMLQPGAFYSTQGSGTGMREISGAIGSGVDPLSSQGSLTLCPRGKRLFAVNAGSGTISGFSVGMDGRLTLTSVVPSGGMQPVSVAIHKHLLYAVNAGGTQDGFASNVTGFTADDQARLTLIPRSTRPLSARGAQPACVAFSPDGAMLAVTELTTNRISLYDVHTDGTLSMPHSNPSSGAGPFGAVFMQSGTLLVAEAGANALSSYDVARGMLHPISASVPNGQSATCWVAATPRRALRLHVQRGQRHPHDLCNQSGRHTAHAANVPATLDGEPAAPIDIGISRDGQNLYALIGNRGAVSAFRIGAGGRMMFMQTAGSSDIPKLGTQGIAVR